MEILFKEQKVAYKLITVEDAVKVVPIMNLIEEAIDVAAKTKKEESTEKEARYHFEVTVLGKVVCMELDEKSMLAMRHILKVTGFPLLTKLGGGNQSPSFQPLLYKSTTPLNINRIHTRKLTYSFSNARIAKNLMKPQVRLYGIGDILYANS